MTRTETKPRPAIAARRVGYVVAVLVNVALAYLINVQPGWEDMSFLTEDTSKVLWVVNLSLAASVVANLIYMIHDDRRVKALGDIVTTAVGLVAAARIWQSFPFDFSDFAVDWSYVVRGLLIVAIVGSVIGLTVQLGTVLRGLRIGG